MRIDNVTESQSFYGNSDTTGIVYEVPAGIGDFKLTIKVNAAGDQGDNPYFTDEAPLILSIDDVISYEALFSHNG